LVGIRIYQLIFSNALTVQLFIIIFLLAYYEIFLFTDCAFISGYTISIDGDEYSNAAQKFDLEAFFNGEVKA
jgi:hypothetical protein